MLYARHPFKKVPDECWPKIRALAEQGVKYEEIGAQYGCSSHLIRKRANAEKWVTPMRLSRAQKGYLAADDPASIVAALWQSRGDQTREDVYQGAKAALNRFFALSPIPSSFAEAKIAHNMIKESINPDGSGGGDKTNVSVNILTNPNFSPKPSNTTINV